MVVTVFVRSAEVEDARRAVERPLGEAQRIPPADGRQTRPNARVAALSSGVNDIVTSGETGLTFFATELRGDILQVK